MITEKHYNAAKDCLQFIHHLRCCKYYADQFRLTYSSSIFAKVFNTIEPKIDWMYKQFLTHHLLVIHVPKTIDQIKYKFESDFAEEMAFNERYTLLNEQQQVLINEVIESLIKGEQIKIETK